MAARCARRASARDAPHLRIRRHSRRAPHSGHSDHERTGIDVRHHHRASADARAIAYANGAEDDSIYSQLNIITDDERGVALIASQPNAIAPGEHEVATDDRASVHDHAERAVKDQQTGADLRAVVDLGAPAEQIEEEKEGKE